MPIFFARTLGAREILSNPSEGERALKQGVHEFVILLMCSFLVTLTGFEAVGSVEENCKELLRHSELFIRPTSTLKSQIFFARAFGAREAPIYPF